MAQGSAERLGPEASRLLSEVMSPSSSAPPQLQQHQQGPLLPQLALQGETPIVQQVVHTVTTFKSGADVEAPDTPTSTASRKRSALSTDIAMGGEPKRSSSPTPSPRPPLIPGLPHTLSAPISLHPAGSPSPVGTLELADLHAPQHSENQLVPAGRSDATSSHHGVISEALPVTEEERSMMRNMVWWYQQALSEDKTRMAELYAAKYNEFEDAARKFQERARDEQDLALIRQAQAYHRDFAQHAQIAARKLEFTEEQAEQRLVSYESQTQVAAFQYERSLFQQAEQQRVICEQAEADAREQVKAHRLRCEVEENLAAQATLKEQKLESMLTAQELHSAEKSAAAMAHLRSQLEQRFILEQQEFLLENAKLKAERDAMARQRQELAEQSKKMEDEATKIRYLSAQSASSVHEDRPASVKSGTTHSFTIIGTGNAPGAADVSMVPQKAAEPVVMSSKIPDPKALQIVELQRKLEALKAEHDADLSECQKEATASTLRGGPSYSSKQDIPAAPTERLPRPRTIPKMFPLSPAAEEEPRSGTTKVDASQKGAAKNVLTSASLNVPCLGSMSSEQAVAASGGIFVMQPSVFQQADGWPTESLPYWIERRNQPEVKSSLALTPSSQQLGSDDQEKLGRVDDVTELLKKLQAGKSGKPMVEITFTKSPNPAEQRGWLEGLKIKCAKGQPDPGEVVRWLTMCEC